MSRLRPGHGLRLGRAPGRRGRVGTLVRLVTVASWLLGIAGGAGGAISSLRAATGEPFVYLVPATGIVDTVLAEYLAAAVATAERDGAAAVVIRLDTPGGSLDATNRIVGTLLEADVPTIVWVAPAGGRAASAGTFITLAAAVALMAPATSIGAASPVGGGGEEITGTLGSKVRNDAVAKIRSIAEARGRDVDWAVSTVERAVASPASEAVEVGAVDGIAESIEEVLAAADGREVEVGGRTATVATAGAAVVPLEMNPFQSFLHALSDPNVAFVLLTVGTYGLVYEVISPNLVTGVIGGIAILLAFIGFGSLPLNVAGLLLIALAVVLFIAEAFLTSGGLVTVAGLVALALGASALYTAPGTPIAPDVSVAFPVIGLMVGLTALLMSLITIVGLRTRWMRGAAGTVGEEALPPGTLGEVRLPLDPLGSLYAGGEEWTARSADGAPLARGTHVRVVARDGLTVVVEPVSDPAGGAGRADPPPGEIR